MGGNPNGLHSLVKYSKLPVERIKYFADANEDTVRSIGRGILFLMAFWSGPAVQAFAKLTEVLATLPAEDLELVVVEVDGSVGHSCFVALLKKLKLSTPEQSVLDHVYPKPDS